MKKTVFSKKSTAEVDVVKQDKQPKKGPVALEVDDLKKVSGGLPRGSWGTNLPRGSWGRN